MLLGKRGSGPHFSEARAGEIKRNAQTKSKHEVISDLFIVISPT
jgi:hypothetical protein